MRLTPKPLANAHVRLEPLAERHREALRAAAADPSLWRWWPRDMSDWDQAFDWQLDEHASGRWILHAVIDTSGQAVGQTCYLSLRPEHGVVEIGGTWYAPQAQGTRVNPAAKLLLLDNAFAAGAARVELKTDALNARSRAAIERLGCAFEGVHRSHMRRPDGTRRDTAWYAIIAEDWPSLRPPLLARLTG